MDIAKALTFIMDDVRWKEKMLVGVGVLVISAILSPFLVGVVGFLIVSGYCIRLLQNVRDGEPTPLPEWDQWGDDLVRGLKWVAVALLWSLPIFLLIVPVGIGGAIADHGGAAEPIGILLLLSSACLVFAYGLFVTATMPGMTVAFARDEEIRSGLQLREIWAWTMQNLSQVMIVTVVYIAASMIIGGAALIGGLLLCLVGTIITIPAGTLLTQLFQFHLYGQMAYNSPLGTGGVRSYPEYEASAGGDMPVAPSSTEV